MSNLIIVTDTSLYNGVPYSSFFPSTSSLDKEEELLDLEAEGFEPGISYDDIKSVFLYDREDPLDYYKSRIKNAENIHFLVTEKCLQHDGLLYGFLNRVFSLGLSYNSCEYPLSQKLTDIKVTVQVCLCESREENLDTFNAFFKIQGFASCVEILEAAGIEYSFSTCKTASLKCEYMISA